MRSANLSSRIGPLTALVATLCLACQPATAAEPLNVQSLRNLPAEAERGELQVLQDGTARIDGTRVRLSPGVQIRDAYNRIVLSASLNEPLLVRYQTDAHGQLHRVWILTAAEAARR